MMQSDVADDEGHYFFFSAPASPVHYILRSPPSSTGPAAAPDDDGDCCCYGTVGDFEFAARGPGHAGSGSGVMASMSSAEELFVAGRIRVGCLSPIRQEDTMDREEDGGEEDGEERDGRAPRTMRRARSASPTRSPRAACRGPEPADAFAPASSSSSSTSSSSSSAKSMRRRISLRDLLTRTGGDCVSAEPDSAVAGAAEIRSGFWPPSIWPSRSSKKALLPCPAPLPGRRSTSSDKPATAKRTPGGGAVPRDESRRRTTSLPYRQGLVLGCLGFGARSYGLAKSMHPLYSR